MNESEMMNQCERISINFTTKNERRENYWEFCSLPFNDDEER